MLGEDADEFCSQVGAGLLDIMIAEDRIDRCTQLAQRSEKFF